MTDFIDRPGRKPPRKRKQTYDPFKDRSTMDAFCLAEEHESVVENLPQANRPKPHRLGEGEP